MENTTREKILDAELISFAAQFRFLPERDCVHMSFSKLEPEFCPTFGFLVEFYQVFGKISLRKVFLRRNLYWRQIVCA